MTSQRKIDSARANGAGSRGPVTPEGKARSSQNANRHGLLANSVVLQGESRERFEELLASLTAELQPRNTVETALVETMANARWRYLRVLSVHTATFDLEMAKQTAPSAVYRAAIAFRKMADTSRVLDLLLRYETAFDRQFHRALRLLHKMRSASADQPSLPAQSELESLSEPGAEATGSPLAPENSIFPNEPKSGHPEDLQADQMLGVEPLRSGAGCQTCAGLPTRQLPFYKPTSAVGN